jgi:hypothetical protein
VLISTHPVLQVKQEERSLLIWTQKGGKALQEMGFRKYPGLQTLQLRKFIDAQLGSVNLQAPLKGSGVKFGLHFVQVSPETWSQF